MTVGLSWSKGEKDEKKPELVEVAVPTTRKKVTGGAMCATFWIVMLVGLIVGALVAVGYFSIERAVHSKETSVRYNKHDEHHLYDRPYHGRRPCDINEDNDDFEFDWDFWEELLEEDFDPQEEYMVEEWFKVVDDVWMVDVTPWLSAPVTILTDTNTDYTVVKADLLDGMGQRCMVLQSEHLSPLLDPIEEFVDDEEAQNLNIQRIVTEFWTIGEPVEEHHEVGQYVRALCQDVEHMHFLLSEEQVFRAEVAYLMDMYDVTYDDMYYWFVDIWESRDDESQLRELLSSFTEIVGFLPDGTYSGHMGPNGMGWSLNVRTRPYNYRGSLTYFDFSAYELE